MNFTKNIKTMVKATLAFIASMCFVVSCVDADLPTASGERKIVQIAASGENFPYTITSNSDWSLVHSEDWITLSDNQGRGTSTITINVKPNPEDKMRTATLSLTCGNKATDITVRQEGMQTSLDVSPTTIALNHTAQTPVASIRATGEWKAVSGSDWLKFANGATEANGSKSSILPIYADINNSVDRTGTITVYDTSVAGEPQFKTIEVTQYANPSLADQVVTLSTESLKFAWDDGTVGTTKTVSFTTNVLNAKVTASSGDTSWCTISGDSDSSNPVGEVDTSTDNLTAYSFDFKVLSNNTTGEARSAVITITASGDEAEWSATKQIVVTQSEADAVAIQLLNAVTYISAVGTNGTPISLNWVNDDKATCNVISLAPWIKVGDKIPATGVTTGVNITVDANSLPVERSGMVQLMANADGRTAYYYMTVVQRASAAPRISVFPSIVTLAGNVSATTNQGTGSVRVIVNNENAVISDVDCAATWISSLAAGTSSVAASIGLDQTFTFTYDENTSDTARETNITFTVKAAGQTLLYTIPVVQNGRGAPMISAIENLQLNAVAYSGTTATAPAMPRVAVNFWLNEKDSEGVTLEVVNVTTNENLSGNATAAPENWLSAAVETATAATTVYVSATANTESEVRTGEITVLATRGSSTALHVISVMQMAHSEAGIVGLPTEITLSHKLIETDGATTGNKIGFDLLQGSTAKVVSSPDWMTGTNVAIPAIPASPGDTLYYGVNFWEGDPNGNMLFRDGTIIIEADNGNSLKPRYEIKVRQYAPGEASLNIEDAVSVDYKSTITAPVAPATVATSRAAHELKFNVKDGVNKVTAYVDTPDNAWLSVGATGDAVSTTAGLELTVPATGSTWTLPYNVDFYNATNGAIREGVIRLVVESDHINNEEYYVTVRQSGIDLSAYSIPENIAIGMNTLSYSLFVENLPAGAIVKSTSGKLEYTTGNAENVITDITYTEKAGNARTSTFDITTLSNNTGKSRQEYFEFNIYASAADAGTAADVIIKTYRVTITQANAEISASLPSYLDVAAPEVTDVTAAADNLSFELANLTPGYMVLADKISFKAIQPNGVEFATIYAAASSGSATHTQIEANTFGRAAISYDVALNASTNSRSVEMIIPIVAIDDPAFDAATFDANAVQIIETFTVTIEQAGVDLSTITLPEVTVEAITAAEEKFTVTGVPSNATITGTTFAGIVTAAAPAMDANGNWVFTCTVKDNFDTAAQSGSVTFEVQHTDGTTSTALSPVVTYTVNVAQKGIDLSAFNVPSAISVEKNDKSYEFRVPGLPTACNVVFSSTASELGDGTVVSTVAGNTPMYNKATGVFTVPVLTNPLSTLRQGWFAFTLSIVDKEGTQQAVTSNGAALSYRVDVNQAGAEISAQFPSSFDVVPTASLAEVAEAGERTKVFADLNLTSGYTTGTIKADGIIVTGAPTFELATKTLTYTLSDNASTESRTGTITIDIVADDDASATKAVVMTYVIDVVQAGVDLSPFVVPASATYAANAATGATLTGLSGLPANCEVVNIAGSGFVSNVAIAAVDATNPTSLSFDLARNLTEEVRKAYITFDVQYASTGTKKTIESYSIEVMQSPVDFGAYTVPFSTPIDMTATSATFKVAGLPADCTIKDAATLAVDTKVVTAAAYDTATSVFTLTTTVNPYEQSREGWIEFEVLFEGESFSPVKNYRVMVLQSGAIVNANVPAMVEENHTANAAHTFFFTDLTTNYAVKDQDAATAGTQLRAEGALFDGVPTFATGTVTYGLTANPTTQARKGYIYIDIEDNAATKNVVKTFVVEVTQAGVDLSAIEKLATAMSVGATAATANAYATLPALDAGYSYSAARFDATVVTAVSTPTGATALTFATSDNATGAERIGWFEYDVLLGANVVETFRVTVRQSGVAISTNIPASFPEFDVTGHPGYEFTVTGLSADYELGTITVTGTGFTGSAVDNAITIVVTANDSATTRTGTLLIPVQTVGGTVVTTYTVALSQAGADLSSLKYSADLYIDAVAATDKTTTISGLPAGCAFGAATSTGIVTNPEVSATGVVTYDVAENTTGVTVQGTISVPVTMNGVTVATIVITVNQAGADLSSLKYTADLYIDAAAATANSTTISGLPAGCAFGAATSTGIVTNPEVSATGVVTYDVAENTASTTAQGTISVPVTMNGVTVTTVVITVNQAGTGTVEVSGLPSEISLGHAVDLSKTLPVITDVASTITYDATSVPAWLNVDITSNDIKFTTKAANSAATANEAYVKFTATSTETVGKSPATFSVYVRQEAEGSVYANVPASVTVEADGTSTGTNSFTVTNITAGYKIGTLSQSGCVISAIATDNLISFVVNANTSLAVKTGTITVPIVDAANVVKQTYTVQVSQYGVASGSNSGVIPAVTLLPVTLTDNVHKQFMSFPVATKVEYNATPADWLAVSYHKISSRALTSEPGVGSGELIFTVIKRNTSLEPRSVDVQVITTQTGAQPNNQMVKVTQLGVDLSQFNASMVALQSATLEAMTQTDVTINLPVSTLPEGAEIMSATATTGADGILSAISLDAATGVITYSVNENTSVEARTESITVAVGVKADDEAATTATEVKTYEISLTQSGKKSMVEVITAPTFEMLNPEMPNPSEGDELEYKLTFTLSQMYKDYSTAGVSWLNRTKSQVVTEGDASLHTFTFKIKNFYKYDRDSYIEFEFEADGGATTTYRYDISQKGVGNLPVVAWYNTDEILPTAQNDYKVADITSVLSPNFELRYSTTGSIFSMATADKNHSAVGSVISDVNANTTASSRTSDVTYSLYYWDLPVVTSSGGSTTVSATKTFTQMAAMKATSTPTTAQATFTPTAGTTTFSVDYTVTHEPQATDGVVVTVPADAWFSYNDYSYNASTKKVTLNFNIDKYSTAANLVNDVTVAFTAVGTTDTKVTPLTMNKLVAPVLSETVTLLSGTHSATVEHIIPSGWNIIEPVAYATDDFSFTPDVTTPGVLKYTIARLVESFTSPEESTSDFCQALFNGKTIVNYDTRIIRFSTKAIFE